MKKIFVSLLVLFCMGLAAITAGAAVVDMDYAQEKITVFGTSESSTVSVIVLNPNMDLDDIATKENAVQNFRKVNVNDDGSFSYSFKIHAANENAGWMSYYTKEEGGDYVGGKVYVASLQEIQDIINEIVTNGIENQTQKDVFLSIFGLSNYAFFTQCDKNQLALRSAQSLAGFEQEDLETDRQKIEKSLKQDSLIEAYEQSLSTAFLDQEGNLVQEPYYELDEYADSQEISVGEVFDSILNQDGKEKVIRSLKGKSYADLTELQKAFSEKVLLYALTNAKDIGYGHVEKILTASNLKFLGMGGTDVSNAKLQRAISASSADFSNAELLKKFVNEYRDNSGGGGGGGSSSKTGGYAGAKYDVDPETGGSEKAQTSFEDLESVPWAEQAIGYLYDKKIISGRNDKEFDPQGRITREEFTKIVVEAFHLEYSKYVIPFEDVDVNQWYAPYVSAACESGVVQGLSENVFGTGEYITRQQLCTMVYRAIKTDGMVKQADFSDYEQVDAYARDAVNYLAYLRVISGFADGSFRPQVPCTRAQTAKIVYEVLRSMEEKS